MKKSARSTSVIVMMSRNDAGRISLGSNNSPVCMVCSSPHQNGMKLAAFAVISRRRRASRRRWSSAPARYLDACFHEADLRRRLQRARVAAAGEDRLATRTVQLEAVAQRRQHQSAVFVQRGLLLRAHRTQDGAVGARAAGEENVAAIGEVHVADRHLRAVGATIERDDVMRKVRRRLAVGALEQGFGKGRTFVDFGDGDEFSMLMR